jgi:hypothetical protein
MESLTKMKATITKAGKVVHTEVVSVNAYEKVFKGSLLCNLFNTPAYDDLWRGQMLLKGDTITLEPHTPKSPFKVLDVRLVA